MPIGDYTECDQALSEARGVYEHKLYILSSILEIKKEKVDKPE